MTLPPYEKHRAERDWYDAAREQEAADAARAEREWRLREELESPDAIESYWVGVMAQMPEHVRRTMYGSDITS